MARWVCIFDDAVGMLDIRQQRRAQHYAYLELHKEQILIAGGLGAGPEPEPLVGALWIMEVVSREEIVQLIENDPYYEPELRKYRLFTWGKALKERKVTL